MPSRSRRNFGGRGAQQKHRNSGSRPQKTRSKGLRKQGSGEARKEKQKDHPASPSQEVYDMQTA